MNVSLFSNAFQIAYVTDDLERAAKVFQENYNTPEFIFFRDMPGALTDMALTYSGSTMFELLQPLAPSGDFYSDHIAGCETFVIKHHHYGMLLDTREEIASVRAKHVANGNEIVYEGGESNAPVQYLYADCRSSLGHYLEYLRLEEDGRRLFAMIPGSPFV